MLPANFLNVLVIFGSAFLLEDVAVLGAALLVVNNAVSLPWAAASSFAGIWIGDLGLYFIALYCGKPVLDRPWFQRVVRKKVDFSRSEMWFQNHGTAAVVMSRAIPGSRLPLYVAAGALRVSLRLFAKTTAICSAIWVAAIFALWRFIPQTSSHQRLVPWLIVALVLFAPWLVGKAAAFVQRNLRSTYKHLEQDAPGLCAP